MRGFWNQTDEAAACFRCCIPLCDRSTVVEDELAGVFRMFESKNASWKQMDSFFFHHRHHVPPWIRWTDLFRYRRVAIVS